jgi:hypothetical protein
MEQDVLKNLANRGIEAETEFNDLISGNKKESVR